MVQKITGWQKKGVGVKGGLPASGLDGASRPSAES